MRLELQSPRGMAPRRIVRPLLPALIILCVALPALVSGASPTDGASTAVLGDFLAPDGRFDIDKARALGFTGTLDLVGGGLTLDPATGAPLFGGGVTTAAVPGDERWSKGWRAAPNLDGPVLAVAIYNGMLVIGGRFATMQGVTVNNIACWNGTAWSSLGAGLSDPDHPDYDGVWALTVFNGNLIAGGQFSQSGTVMTSGAASWDGSAWSALGTGPSGSVYSLFVFNGMLHAGGDLTDDPGPGKGDGDPAVARSYGYGLQVWSGSAWGWPYPGLRSSYRNTGIVNAMAVYGGRLWVAGGFDSSEGFPLANIAYWDGVSWQSPGAGLNAGVGSLCVKDGSLYAGGAFGASGTTVLSRIARWDGGLWHDVGGGVTGVPGSPTVNALAVDGARLIVGGSFSAAGGVSAAGLASWDGSVWRAVGSGTNGTVNALGFFDTELLVGGEFTVAGGGGAKYLARRAGNELTRFGDGLARNGSPGWVYALGFYGGVPIAGGLFSWAGETAVNNLARWNGNTWEALGLGVSGVQNAQVHCMLEYAGGLVVGGTFSQAGSVTAYNIAFWNGVTWSAIGIGTPVGTDVRALTAYNGDLIAAGTFNRIAGLTVDNIARWNGSAWSPIGSGFGNYTVRALAVYGGTLVAGGDFQSSGAVITGSVARWTGSAWAMLGDARAHESAYALAVHDGALYAGGDASFGPYGGGGVFRWDGVSWTRVGDGFVNGTSSMYIRSLASCGGRLVATGDFTGNGGAAQYARIASWSGTAWEALGSGLDAGGNALIANGDQLIVGGRFTMAGAKSASGLSTGRFSWNVTGTPDGPPTPRLALAVVPNPFNPRTTISFTLADPGRVRLAVYDVRGRRVRELLDAQLGVGRQEVLWDGRDASGRAVAGGVYLFRVESDAGNRVVRGTLVK
jgi:trimeric autotransporter adhesin